MNIHELIDILAKELNLLSDQNRSLGAAAYMKHKFVFIGVDATTRKNIQKDWFKLINDHFHLRWEIITELWLKEEREYHYVAIDWINSWNKKYLEEVDIEKLEWLLTNHSWWDSVDAIASNVLGTYFQKFPTKIHEVISIWRDSDNFWLQRSCLIFQLKYRGNVNFELLKSLIIQFMPNKEFFIQKAIGWSLRQYSKFNSSEVKLFVEEVNLQGLARREATKYI